MAEPAAEAEHGAPAGGAERFRPARALIEAWALLGGLVLLAIVLMTAVSAMGNLFMDQPIPGDFELVQVGVAISAFAFLPYCQLTGANVTADIFTSRAGPRAIAVFSLLGSLIAFASAAILIWRMYLGMADYREYEELTPIVGFPIWMAFVPILASLAILILASGITTLEAFRAAARRPAR